MKVLKISVGIILAVISAIMMADSVITVTTGTHVFFPDVQPAFEFVVGLITVMTASPQIQESKD
jgi:MinD superfamily P-loop ATPase